MKYVIIDKNRHRLSQFVPNSCPAKALFRKRDYIIFSSESEAKEYIEYIQSYGIRKKLFIEKDTF